MSETVYPKKKSKAPLIIGIIVSIFLLACIGGMAAMLIGAGKAVDESLSTPLNATPIGKSGSAAPKGSVVSKGNVKLSLKTRDKQCFGSAGCSLTVKVEMTLVNFNPAPDAEYLVTYEIKGDESGPITGSFEVYGDQYEVNEEFMSTKSKDSKVSVQVTDVETR